MGSHLSKLILEAPSSAEKYAATAVIETGSGDKRESVKESADKKTKSGACCACPETKQARDQCFVEHGAEHCLGVIDAYQKCMREAGFSI